MVLDSLSPTFPPDKLQLVSEKGHLACAGQRKVAGVRGAALLISQTARPLQTITGPIKVDTSAIVLY